MMAVLHSNGQAIMFYLCDLNAGRRPMRHLPACRNVA